MIFNVDFDTGYIKTPYYIVDEVLLEENLKKIRMVADEAGCKILLAQKAFSMFYEYPLIARYLDGVTASGLYEARLGHEEMKRENHIFSPVYFEEEFEEILSICDHIIFNSFSQWKKYRERARKSGKEFGLRINPECSTGDHEIYDPCAKGSRLGITKDNFDENELMGISGLHIHTLCEQNSDALETTIAAAEEKFGQLFYRMKWLNLGGGHHITRENYDIPRLIKLIKRIKTKYDVEVYLEPGEAIALNTGYLVSTVEDIISNGMDIAILDTSAACHMPDVLEMPYRPHIIGSGLSGEYPFTYRLGGPTCLAGDIIGDYSFMQPLQIGDRLIFCDMAHYSMVKNNTFNGMRLPTIAAIDKERRIKMVKLFGYHDFKYRLS